MEIWEDDLFHGVQELNCYRIHLEYGKSEILLSGKISFKFLLSGQVPGYSGSAGMESAPGEHSDYLILPLFYLLLTDIKNEKLRVFA